jgi:hypothetical protein
VDSDGNPILIGTDDDGRLLEVVIALDDPEFVITVISCPHFHARYAEHDASVATP